MGKLVLDAAMDAAFDYIRARVTQITVCSTQPTTLGLGVSMPKV